MQNSFFDRASMSRTPDIHVGNSFSKDSFETQSLVDFGDESVMPLKAIEILVIGFERFEYVKSEFALE